MTEQGHEAGQERVEKQCDGVPPQPSGHQDDAPSPGNVGTDLARMVAELGATVRAHLDGLGHR